MPLEEFIIWIYVCVAENLEICLDGKRLRRSGPMPKLSDAEVIAMEIIGEYFGYDTDRQIWKYFKTHWNPWFPGLGSRSQFAKQASNLWSVKQMIQEKLAYNIGGFSDDLHMVDGFPMSVCHYARSGRCKSFKDEAAYSYCASKKEKYYGFSGHVMISGQGCITGFTFTAANVDERDAMLEITNNIKGLLLGDKGYIRPALQEYLAKIGINLQTPLRDNMQDDRDPEFIKLLISTRRLVETVIGQLTERFNIAKVWARDAWHQTNRVARKILSHTMAMACAKKLGLPPLQFENIIMN